MIEKVFVTEVFVPVALQVNPLCCQSLKQLSYSSSTKDYLALEEEISHSNLSLTPDGSVIRIANCTGLVPSVPGCTGNPPKGSSCFFSLSITKQLLKHQAPVVKGTHVLETYLVGRFCASLQAACPLFPEPPYLKKPEIFS